MKNILTEALVNSATNASFIFSYTNSAKLRLKLENLVSFHVSKIVENLKFIAKKCKKSIKKYKWKRLQL